MSQDRIVKQIVLAAPQERVWRAISDSSEFGHWFGVDLDGPFVEGRWTDGRIRPTRVDEEIAAAQAPYAGMRCDMYVERIAPMRELVLRWHPGAEEIVDRDTAPTTLVTFTLEPVEGGTRLTIVESGFDRLPAEIRAKAFAGNAEGWEIQTRLIARYLAQSPS